MVQIQCLDDTGNIESLSCSTAMPELSTPVEEKLFCLPSLYVQDFGASNAAIMYGIASRLAHQTRRIKARGSRYVLADGSPAVSSDLFINAYPWIRSSKTFYAGINAMASKGVLIVEEDHQGAYRESEKLGHYVRRPFLYGMTKETMEKILDPSGLLHVSPSDAYNLKINTALVWNRVQFIFEVQRRDHPERATVILAPAALARYLHLTRSNVRDCLAKLVKLGYLQRLGATPEYAIVKSNALKKKILERSPFREFKPIEGLSSEMQQAALKQMTGDIRHWYRECTGVITGPAEEIHFRKGAEICLFNHFNPRCFVYCNLGSGKLNKKAAFLHGVNAEQKYLDHNSNISNVPSNREFSKLLLAARIACKDDLTLNAALYTRLERENPRLSPEEIYLLPESKMKAWCRVIACPPESPYLEEILEKYAEEGRYEVQSRETHFMEAISELGVVGWYPANLFPYYRNYYDSAQTEKRSKISANDRTKWRSCGRISGR